MAGILNSGDVYFNRKNPDGSSTGLVHIGNTTQFQITESSTIKERTSKRKATYGQPLDSVAIKSPAKIAITLDEMNRPNLALVCLGADAAAIQNLAADQTKNFDLADVVVGVAYEIGHKGIVVSSVKIDTDVVPAAAYEIDAEGGLITFTDATPATGTLVVTYGAPLLTGFVISGSASPTIKGNLRLVSRNLADQSLVEVDVLEAVLTPKSGLDFLASDYASAQFEGSLVTPAGQTSPYTVTVLQAA